jgi:Na+/proline symporter
MGTSWLRAVILAAIMLTASYLLFVLVPNNLLSYLSPRTAPRNRDLLVTLWWVVAFVFGCWLFVRSQRTRAR